MEMRERNTEHDITNRIGGYAIYCRGFRIKRYAFVFAIEPRYRRVELLKSDGSFPIIALRDKVREEMKTKNVCLSRI